MRFKIVYGSMFKGVSRVLSKHSSLKEAEAEFKRLLGKEHRKRPLAVWFDQPNGENALILASYDFYNLLEK